MEWCHDPGCNAELALPFMQIDSADWRVVEEFTYCPLHWPAVVYRARRAAQEEQRIAKLAAKHATEARVKLSESGYRAWDEFQADMANFHSETGRLAPKRLRTMAPREFLAHYAANGRIDIAAVEKALDANEAKAQAARIRIARDR